MLVQPLSIHKVPPFAEQFRAAAPSLVKALATLRLKESKLSMKTTPWPRKKSEGFRISMGKLDMRMSRNKKQHMWIYSKQQQWGFHQKTGVATDVSPPIWSLDWLKLLHLWKLNPHVMFAGEITSIIELQSTCLLQNSFILINYHFLVHITDIPGFIATFPSTFHHYRKNTVNPLNQFPNPLANHCFFPAKTAMWRVCPIFSSEYEGITLLIRYPNHILWKIPVFMIKTQFLMVKSDYINTISHQVGDLYLIKYSHYIPINHH